MTISNDEEAILQKMLNSLETLKEDQKLLAEKVRKKNTNNNNQTERYSL